MSNRIKEALTPLIAERDQLLAELEDVEAKRLELRSEVKTIEGLLRAGGLLDKKETKSRATKKASWISEEMLDHARDVMPAGPFTVADMEELMEVSQGTARKAIEALKAAGDLRFLGKRKVEGRNGMKPMHWEAIPERTRR